MACSSEPWSLLRRCLCFGMASSGRRGHGSRRYTRPCARPTRRVDLEPCCPCCALLRAPGRSRPRTLTSDRRSSFCWPSQGRARADLAGSMEHGRSSTTNDFPHPSLPLLLPLEGLLSVGRKRPVLDSAGSHQACVERVALGTVRQTEHVLARAVSGHNWLVETDVLYDAAASKDRSPSFCRLRESVLSSRYPSSRAQAPSADWELTHPCPFGPLSGFEAVSRVFQVPGVCPCLDGRAVLYRADAKGGRSRPGPQRFLALGLLRWSLQPHRPMNDLARGGGVSPPSVTGPMPGVKSSKTAKR